MQNSSAIIGGAFPLLFGQGQEQQQSVVPIGGLAGGLAGGQFGFALSRRRYSSRYKQLKNLIILIYL